MNDAGQGVTPAGDGLSGHQRMPGDAGGGIPQPEESGLRIGRRPGPPDDDPCFEMVPLTEDRMIPGAEPLDHTIWGPNTTPGTRFFLDADHYAPWDLIRAIEEDWQPISNACNARLAQEMIQGMYASHLRGGKVTFPLEDRTHPLGEE